MGWLKEKRRAIAKNWEFRRRQKPGAPVTATVRWEDDRCITTVGDREFFIRSEAITRGDVSVYDFLIFPLTVLSAQFHLRIAMDFPVSESARDRLPRLKTFIDGWCMATMASPDLVALQVVADPVSAGGGGILCMSGGFDSTAAALEARGSEFTHGLLFAGADYPNAQSPGFIELRGRVEEIARRLGYELVVLETDIRRLHIKWELFHGWVLAMGLHFHSGRFSVGGVGLDLPVYLDPMVQPWGGGPSVYAVLSLHTFQVKGFNQLTSPEEKAAAVAASEFGLLPLISTCYAMSGSSQNCGKCRKCLNTRIRLQAAGYDFSPYCVETPDILSAYSFLVPRGHRQCRLMLVLVMSLLEVLPPGEMRDRFEDFARRLREAMMRQLPVR